MAKYSRIVEIDGEKLKKALAQRDLALVDASLTLGFGASYMSNAVHRGAMSVAAAKLLDSQYNIHLDDIKPDEPKQEPKQEPEQIELAMPAGFTYQEIAQAVAEGVRAAFEVIFEEYAIYKVGGVQTVRKRAEREPDHE